MGHSTRFSTTSLFLRIIPYEVFDKSETGPGVLHCFWEKIPPFNGGMNGFHGEFLGKPEKMPKDKVGGSVR